MKNFFQPDKKAKLRFLSEAPLPTFAHATAPTVVAHPAGSLPGCPLCQAEVGATVLPGVGAVPFPVSFQDLARSAAAVRAQEET